MCHFTTSDPHSPFLCVPPSPTSRISLPRSGVKMPRACVWDPGYTPGERSPDKHFSKRRGVLRRHFYEVSKYGKCLDPPQLKSHNSFSEPFCLVAALYVSIESINNILITSSSIAKRECLWGCARARQVWVPAYLGR
jgi:hypothetical protein